MNSFKVKKIRQSNLGHKLKECREEKKNSLDQVYKIIGIPIKYLQAMEEERWQDLPGEVYLKKFLDKYCHFLGLNFKLCFKQYQKQKTKTKLSVLHDKKIKKNKNKNKFFVNFLTPKKFNIILISTVLLILLSYLFVQINDYIRPPELKIDYPQGNLETSENIITIKGKTEIEAVVFINGESISVEEDGNFNSDVKLKFGLNRFYISSQRKHGQKNEKEIIILKKQFLDEVTEENE